MRESTLTRNVAHIGCLFAFFSTMPGHGFMQALLVDLRLYSVDHFGVASSNSGLPILDYPPSMSVSLLTSLLWMSAFGYSLRASRDSVAKLELLKCFLVIFVLMAGKCLDLVYEGRVFSGNYFAWISVLVLLFWSGKRNSTGDSNPR